MLSQFPVNTVSYTLPFVESEERANAVRERINTLYQQTGVRPLVFYSIISQTVRDIINSSDGFCQDIVQVLVAPLQGDLNIPPAPEANRIHGLTAKTSANMMRASPPLTIPLPTTMAFHYAISIRRR